SSTNKGSTWKQSSNGLKKQVSQAILVNNSTLITGSANYGGIYVLNNNEWIAKKQGMIDYFSGTKDITTNVIFQTSSGNILVGTSYNGIFNGQAPLTSISWVRSNIGAVDTMSVYSIIETSAGIFIATDFGV